MMKTSPWQLPRYQTDWQSICALLPTYLPDGENGSRILFADGSSETVAARLSWVLEDLLRGRRSSKQVLAQQSNLALQKLHEQPRRRLPLLLSADFCLVPVKARQPQSRHHGADGYVVFSAVQKVAAQPDQAGSMLTLAGSACPVLDTPRTVQANLRLAARLLQTLEQTPA